MSKRLASVAKSNPGAEAREDVKAVAEDIDTYAALDAFARSEAGRIVHKSLLQDVGASIDAISSNWRTLTHPELMALTARLEARLALMRSLDSARTNLDLAEEALTEMTT